MLPKNGFLIDRSSKKQVCGTRNMLDELVEVLMKHRRTNNTKTYPLLQFHHSHAFQQQNGFLIDSESISIGWEKKLKWKG
jgi:hypothetical protein